MNRQQSGEKMISMKQRGRFTIAKLLLISASTFVLGTQVNALVFNLPTNGENIVGHMQTVQAGAAETLNQIGLRHDIGLDEMVEANPGIPKDKPIPTGTDVIVPTRFILPDAPHRGIVINLAELRLYYYPKNSNQVVTVPVGIGKAGGWQTPVGTTKVVAKETNPTWRPTDNVRADAARLGYLIPAVFPPGPDNPLGKFAIRLGWPEYLIHSTNQPEGVGQRVSAGCIRMDPDDIAALYPQIAIGTPVTVVNEPYKVSWYKGRLYLESHQPLQEQYALYSDDAIPMVQIVSAATQGKAVRVLWNVAKQVAEHPTGIPVAITQ